MTRNTIDYSPRAEKALRAIRDERIGDPIKRAIMGLADQPRPPGALKLVGEDDLWRLRVGDWRIIADLDDGVMLITVIRLGNRREIYRR